MGKIKVSIICAVHNGENGLANCLDSIRRQTLTSYEVIMVDAASTDSTADIMKKYEDKKFRYYRIDRPDIEEARNLGLEYAVGEYTGFCDNCVSFTKKLFRSMADLMAKNNAPVCISRMASSDVYGRHEFTSTDLLSLRKITDKFDMDLIWNPSVSNKLFRTSEIKRLGISFGHFGKAQDAAFSLEYCLKSDFIACCSKGYTCYNVPATGERVTSVEISDYLSAYDCIRSYAIDAFNEEKEKADTQFEKKELDRLRTCWLDTVTQKELTVLLYSYYRHFWSLDSARIKEYAELISMLCIILSSGGKKALFSKNSDIFYDGELLTDRKTMADRPKVTVCIGRCDNRGHFDTERLRAELKSIYEQTMPCFELFADSRLEDIFPEEYCAFENLRFITAESISDFKQKSLEQSSTDYIMYLDGYVLLNPKILMRHYSAHVRSGSYAFTTSPITQFDGISTGSYVFSDMAFFDNISYSRASQSDAFTLDLFMCNKMFSVKYLRGTKFVFTDNTLLDMYKLYERSRFKKLSHRGTYFPYDESEVISFMKKEQSSLPSNCKKMFSGYKRMYFRSIKVKKTMKKITDFLKLIMRSTLKNASALMKKIFALIPLKNRAFFYSIRSDVELKENCKLIYDALDCKKVVYAKKLPHPVKDIPKILYCLCTSRVIITDDYLKYLRSVRLRESQRVVQLWHAGGAFKRFGLDAPSKLTTLEEYNTHSQYTDVFVTSECVRQFYAHAFGIEPEIVKALGSPRTDELLNSDNISAMKQDICSRHPLLKNKKIFVYFPTFREKDGERTEFDPGIDWDGLDSDLYDDEIFIISRHPAVDYEYIAGKHYSRLKDYSDESTSALIAVADVVITDYSSVIFDSSLLGKPCVFYCPDEKNYERSFYLDFPSELPGPVVNSPTKLLSCVRDVMNNPPVEKIKLFTEKEMSACDGHSTERIAEYIGKYLK